MLRGYPGHPAVGLWGQRVGEGSLFSSWLCSYLLSDLDHIPLSLGLSVPSNEGQVGPEVPPDVCLWWGVGNSCPGNSLLLAGRTQHLWGRALTKGLT